MADSRSFSTCEASSCWRVNRSRASCKNTSLLLCRLFARQLAEYALQLFPRPRQRLLAFRAQGLFGLEPRAQQLRFDAQSLLATRAPQQRRQGAEDHAHDQCQPHFRGRS